MPTCAKCGQEVDEPATLCGACAPVDSAPVDSAPNAPPAYVDGVVHVPEPTGITPVQPPTATIGRRALGGAQGGAIVGAIYGGAYGLMLWFALSAFASTTEDTSTVFVRLVLAPALFGAAGFAVLGAVFRIFFPAKPRIPPAAPLPEAAIDTRLDKP